ncbi:hypothetical protein [Lacimonas salitolerans]|uniref:DUF2946 family protein n=1 Tax=Lacimonas salitolerans TaxID=1323750 RepID=A0ABW4EBA3_9RHOB
MIAFRHPLLSAVLVLVLALTGQSMAIARGMPGPAGQMVLCTGSGPVTVLVDEDGQPTSPPHICPECTQSLFAAHWDAPAPQSHAAPRLIALSPGAQAAIACALAPLPQARGPPVLS